MLTQLLPSLPVINYVLMLTQLLPSLPVINYVLMLTQLLPSLLSASSPSSMLLSLRADTESVVKN